MAAVTVTAVKVKPLPGAIIRDFVAAGVVNTGDLVYVDSNGKVQQASGGAAGTANAIGVVVSVGTFGATAAAIGDTVSVAVLGPVTGFSSMTPGNRHYVSDTAGVLSTTAGTTSKVMGIAIAADIFYILHNM
jgi:hypothetical protein